MRSNTQGRHRGRVVNVARQVQLLLGRIVMIAEKIVRLHDVHVMDLCCLQDFPRTLCASNVAARTHLAPSAKRAGHPNLRPNSNDQRDADVEQPVGTQTKTEWAADIEQTARSQNKTQ